MLSCRLLKLLVFHMVCAQFCGCNLCKLNMCSSVLKKQTWFIIWFKPGLILSALWLIRVDHSNPHNCRILRCLT